ncbi:MAG: PPC domain-containing protein [Anaerolineaceae bacterium]|nr:PPC domain-containing protein [Anaerolineaceae bacterium]
MSGRRTRALLLLMVFVLHAGVAGLSAQQSRELLPGDQRSGALSLDMGAQVYTFSGETGDLVSLAAEAGDAGVLSLLVTDADGEMLAQASGVAMEGFALPEAGRYYVTVLAPGGLPESGTLEFSLTFDLQPAPVEQVSAEEVTVPVFAPGEVVAISGLRFQLQWESLANLDLEIRDPVGGSVYFSRPVAPSGGAFGENVNSVCETRSGALPTEVVNWSGGGLPTGSYEILVYNQPLGDCPTSGAADFRVDVRLDDTNAPALVGSLAPGETWLGSVRVDAAGMLQAGAGGVATDETLTPAGLEERLESAIPLQPNQVQTGLITSAEPANVYSFTGSANEVISVSLSATSGSLDTLLQLLDGSGTVLSANDDLEDGSSTNSDIRNFRLFADGEYRIVATRYGKELGGTEGHYEILLSTAEGELAADAFSLSLPGGDLEIILSWNNNVDLQLLVRDPAGNSVYDDIPQVPSGGRLAAAGNVNCSGTGGNPVSYVYWPEGTLTAGLYEVEVWHQNSCNDITPITFALNAFANGAPVFSHVARPVANQVFVTSFIIGVDGQAQAGDGGFVGIRGQGLETLSLGSLDFRPEFDTAPLLTSSERVSGNITNENSFDLYAIEGVAGDVVTVSMVATAGRLDTALALLDPQGFRLADNDDAIAGENTDSLIREHVLLEDGRHYVLATHYGMGYGGTTGSYDLLYSRLNPG